MFASTFPSDNWPCFSTVLTPLFSSLPLPYRYLPSMTMPAFVLFSRHFKANMLTVSLDWVIFPKRFVWDVGCFLTLGHLAGITPLPTVATLCHSLYPPWCHSIRKCILYQCVSLFIIIYYYYSLFFPTQLSPRENRSLSAWALLRVTE